jgi:hypothetical protein
MRQSNKSTSMGRRCGDGNFSAIMRHLPVFFGARHLKLETGTKIRLEYLLLAAQGPIAF